jgi:branched-chain amino acid transport system substrate-binding protein
LYSKGVRRAARGNVDVTGLDLTRRRALLGGLSLMALSACTGTFDFPTFGGPKPPPAPVDTVDPGHTIGSGPVRVALLLPLSGDASLTPVGQSMANGAQLAMDFVASNPNMTDNITLVIRDTGSTTAGAASAASAAVQDGSALVLGPLKAEQVTAASGVTRSAGIPMIAFSNNSGAAQPGVYLLNVLPETEARRSLGYAKGLGKRAFAGIFPSTSFGQIQQAAFQQAVADLGLRVVGTYSFSSEAEARDVVTQLAPTLLAGQVDTLFLPDRGTAPSFGALLGEAKVPPGGIQIVGSADWNGDPTILATPYLAGALYPAVDDKGYQALLPQYQQRFGGTPHPFVTLAYTAVILANVSSLSMGQPKYDQSLLTSAGGFNGRDGVFRFNQDGTSQYALVIKKTGPGGAAVVDAARL